MGLEKTYVNINLPFLLRALTWQQQDAHMTVRQAMDPCTEHCHGLPCRPGQLSLNTCEQVTTQ